MAFAWAITGENLIRSTWKDAQVLSASSEATGYPGGNAIDGNIESQWKAAVNGAHNIVIDSGDAALDMDYLCLRFGIDNLPTSVKIETSSDNIAYSGIANNYDGTVATTTSSAVDGTSRTIPVTSSANFQTGNTVRINDASYDERYLVVAVGVGYIEVDRLPKPFTSGAAVTVYPGPVIVALVAGAESKRYIKITVTGTPAHILEAQAFKVEFSFDNTTLPLNPEPVQRQIDVGQVFSSFSGNFIGKMQTGPSRSQWRIVLARTYRDANAVIDWILRQDRIGLLMDDGTWWEVIPVGSIPISRRPSNDAELVTYYTELMFQEC